MDTVKLGAAGELRVASELLLRGHNPARPYSRNGTDFLLENGLRIEVKSGHANEWGHYHFGNQANVFYDFIICWCIEDNAFYIIPRDAVKHLKVIYINKDDSSWRNHFAQHKDNWSILK